MRRHVDSDRVRQETHTAPDSAEIERSLIEAAYIVGPLDLDEEHLEFSRAERVLAVREAEDANRAVVVTRDGAAHRELAAESFVVEVACISSCGSPNVARRQRLGVAETTTAPP